MLNLIMPALLSLDATARTFDTDGRLHINRSHISKACVNPYYGSEIPNYEMLGLDPLKVYRLLRSPEELAKGAPTFERLPILKKHIPVTAYSPRQELIVGSIGSEVEFLAPYLDADVCIWDAGAIAGIETETIREFSCSYHYVAVMQPGEFEGKQYDGIITEIRGNHLALVESGRAGSDVLAADRSIMKMTKLGKALCAALGTAFPKLAQDSAFLPTLVGEASKKTFNRAEVRAKLIALDAECKPDAVMDAIIDVEDDPKPKAAAKDADPDETEEEREAREKKAKDAKAKDEKDDEEKADEEKRKTAMDAFRLELRQAEDARREVRPVVGDVIAQDSAAEIYAFALDQMKIAHDGVEGIPALRALFNLATTKTAPAPRVALDSASLETRFPDFNRVRRG